MTTWQWSVIVALIRVVLIALGYIEPSSKKERDEDTQLLKEALSRVE